MPSSSRSPGVYIKGTRLAKKTIVPASTTTTVLIGAFPKGRPYSPANIRSLQELDQTYGGLKVNNLPSLASKQFFENGGKNLWIISTGVRFSKTATPFIKALSLLSKIPNINLLLIPETSALSIQEAGKIFQTAVSLIEQYRAIYLIDPPQQDVIRQNVNDLVRWAKAQPVIQHPNVILYYPRVTVRSPILSLPPVNIANSGTIAGVFTRFDGTRGVWKAPAGTEARLQGISGLERKLTTKDIQNLASANINPLKQISASAYLIWGARTLSSNPEWKYVAVRRTALFLETTIQQGTAWSVFEPNDEPLWAQIRQSIETFMEGLFRQGAFQGSRMKDAYFVRCGRETITVADQAAGRVHIMVGFAPLKPAEFVIIKIKQNARSFP